MKPGSAGNLDTYLFHEGELSPEINLDFETAIFNTRAFSSLQESSNWIFYSLLNKSKQRAAAGLRFNVRDGIARSPFRAPFGSAEFSDTLNPAELYRFLELVQSDLKHRGVSEVYIRNFPRAYFPEHAALLEVFLLNQGFVVSDSEIASVMPVTNEPFIAGIRHAEKLRIQQAQKAGFTFRRIPKERIDEVYHFIDTCHRDKGYKLSISLPDLRSAASAFPDHYLLFGVYDNDRMAAASVSIRVYADIMYNFLVNHDKRYNSVSPPVLLMEGIYDHCREEGMRLFDLGTSALDGKPNFPLMNFKTHIGGKPSARISFFKKLT